MRHKTLIIAASTALVVALAATAAFTVATHGASASSTTYNINTLAGKVASVNGTAGLQIRFSAFIQQEADDGDPAPAGSVITPTNVLSSPLDGTSIVGPDITANQDTAAAPQNETAIAVDPNNPNRVVGSANDYVSRTWACDVNGTPCSALGDGYSGTYVSNDGGKTWCCTSSDPQHLGTLIPGVTRLAGGQYDAGGDPAVTFDSRGNVYYAGLGFNRASAPNTVTVNKGTFDGSGAVTWGAPTFINPTTSPSIFNDKEWIAADHYASSAYRDRVYVSWTRFVFNPQTGAYVQSPISLVYSTDGGKTFSDPQLISGNVLYDQGSRPVVGPDGSVYVFFEGSTRFAQLDSTYVVKSTDGGATFGKPVAISTLHDINPPANTSFRVNSFPAADAAPNGDLYAAWSTAASDGHSQAVYSKSTDGGATWSAPALIFPETNRTAIGYPVTQPDGSTLNAPAARKADTFWPGVAISPSGKVYMSAYSADVVSPWQKCAASPAPPVGRITCTTLGNYIHNARLDYFVTDLTTGNTEKATTQPINTRYGFGGGFIGDYTGLAVGSDDTYHALWTDTNNEQTVVWFYGAQFTPTLIHQEDVATRSGNM